MASPQIENGHIKLANDFFRALCKTRIPGQARQVLDFIISKTWGWNKKEDMIPLSQFVVGTGLQKYDVIDARNKLVGMNIIIVAQKGNEETLTYSIQKDFDKWNPLPKRAMTHNRCPKGQQPVAQKGNASLPKTPPSKDTTSKDTIQKTVASDDAEFLGSLKQNRAYKHVNIEFEIEKMKVWLSARPGRKLTRRFIINWLNKIEMPFNLNQSVNSKSPDPDCKICGGHGVLISQGTGKRNPCSCTYINQEVMA